MSPSTGEVEARRYAALAFRAAVLACVIETDTGLTWAIKWVAECAWALTEQSVAELRQLALDAGVKEASLRHADQVAAYITRDRTVAHRSATSAESGPAA